METHVASSRLKIFVISSLVLVAAALWAGAGFAGKASESAVSAPNDKAFVEDKNADQELREKVFLHRLGMGLPAAEPART